jgi:hypothetical protein
VAFKVPGWIECLGPGRFDREEIPSLWSMGRAMSPGGRVFSLMSARKKKTMGRKPAKKKAVAKKPAKKSTGARRRKPAKKTGSGWLGRIWRLLLLAAGVFLGLLLPWVVYLNHQVTTEFEGRKWDLPSRVYARALDIYPGLPLSTEDLELELSVAGYSKAQSASRPGFIEPPPTELRFSGGLSISPMVRNRSCASLSGFRADR